MHTYILHKFMHNVVLCIVKCIIILYCVDMWEMLENFS